MSKTKAKARAKPAAARPAAGGRGRNASNEQMLVELFRVLTEEQFDYWIACLNRAVVTMGGKADAFTRDDRQKTISYWYLLMFLLETYAAGRNPFAVGKGETWLSEGLMSMEALSKELGSRFKEETIRRYVFDLKSFGLIALQGRGAKASVQLSAPAVRALTDTIRQWVVTFREVDKRIGQLPEF